MDFCDNRPLKLKCALQVNIYNKCYFQFENIDLTGGWFILPAPRAVLMACGFLYQRH
jgi:hypothetical protein